jgi:uncharacterized membrane protein
MIHSWIGFVHTAAAIAALLLGALVLCRRKGTPAHRVIGYGYAVSMMALLLSAFSIYRLTRHFNALHFFAIVSAATLAGALIPAIIRRPRDSWLRLHYRLTSWSYVGLLSATAAEIAIRAPGAPFWGGVFAGGAIVSIIGGFAIESMRARTLAKIQRFHAYLGVEDSTLPDRHSGTSARNR